MEGILDLLCPRISETMSEPAEDCDILGWELDQLKKLKLLAEAYGWDEEDPKYKAKLKQVQQLGKQRAAEALGKGGGKEAKAPRKAYIWESMLEFKAKDWDEAKTKLQKIHTGEWHPDRRCPQSESGGLVTRRFKCTDKEEGMIYLARIIASSPGNWLLQRGIVETMDEEEPSDDEKPPDDDDDDGEEGGAGPSKGRRGAGPPAKKVKAASAAAPAPAPAAAAGKRGRKRAH